MDGTERGRQDLPLEHMLMRLVRMADESEASLPPADTLEGDASREFFANNWRMADEGLLSRSHRVRVLPEPSPHPRVFRIEFDRPYKRKRSRDAPVELVPGPICGTIMYRPNPFDARDERMPVAVLLDQDQDFFHPNFSRRFRLVCLGNIPASPMPLEALIEHLYSILSYQNRTPTHPADVEAARYFALDPDAMSGLAPVEPLY